MYELQKWKRPINQYLFWFHKSFDVFYFFFWLFEKVIGETLLIQISFYSKYSEQKLSINPVSFNWVIYRIFIF